jgi:hypothetical protein
LLKFVMRDRRMTTVDEANAREELAEIMVAFRRDFDAFAHANQQATPYLLEANRSVATVEFGGEGFLRPLDEADSSLPRHRVFVAWVFRTLDRLYCPRSRAHTEVARKALGVVQIASQ